jgi:hypothetical protein
MRRCKLLLLLMLLQRKLREFGGVQFLRNCKLYIFVASHLLLVSRTCRQAARRLYAIDKLRHASATDQFLQATFANTDRGPYNKMQ